MSKRVFSVSIKFLLPTLLAFALLNILATLNIYKSVEHYWVNNTLKSVSEYDNAVLMLLDNAKDNTTDITRQIANQCGMMFSNGVVDTQGNPAGGFDIPESLRVQGMAMENPIIEICRSLKQNYNLESISIIDQNQQFITPKELTSYYVVSDNMKGALTGREYSDYYELDGNLLAICTLPIKTSDNKIVGAVEVAVKLTTDKFINYVKSVTDCEFTIIKGDTRISSTITELNGKKIDASVYQDLTNDKKVVTSITLNNSPYGACYFSLPGITTKANQFYFFVGKNVSAMYKALDAVNQDIIKTQGVIVIIILLIVVLNVLMIVLKPLKRTSKAMWNLSSGDADLTVRLPENGNDEFTDLSRAVNKFIDMLHEIVKDIRNESENISYSVNDLKTSSHETASATSEIIANIDSIKQQAIKQANAVSETGLLVENSTGNVRALKVNLDKQKQDVEETSAVIEEMIGNTRSVTDSANKLKNAFTSLEQSVNQGIETVVSCSKVIKSVDDKSHDLSGANETITAIAAQTNLLAMNAAIEAAHAGEAGKGFAVVAGEIRKLAEDSTKQAEKIQRSIGEITELITKGTELSDLSKQSLSEIGNQVNIVDPLVNQISSAMEEQSSGTTQVLESLENMKTETANVDESAKTVNEDLVQINLNMESVNQISSMMSASMEEMATGSQQINRATQNVSDLSVNAQNNVVDITKKISKFKL